MIDLPFFELAVGQKKTSRGRTMTETDVVNFCMLTGNWLELHSNIEFARHTLYGQRLVQGSMVFSIVNAMIRFDPEVVEAFYGVDRLRFIKPTFIGDTLHASAEIIRLKEHGSDHGVATSMLNGVNQRGETVMSCEFSLLVRKLRLAPSTTAPEAKS